MNPEYNSHIIKYVQTLRDAIEGNQDELNTQRFKDIIDRYRKQGVILDMTRHLRTQMLDGATNE